MSSTDKTYPISEIFGPTIQGEGPLIGTPTLFARFSGCNDRCFWCDTKYAVSPEFPGWAVTRMTAIEICEKLNELGAFQQVTLSGGNPALFVDYELLDTMQKYGFYVTMETQGNRPIPPMALKHPTLRYLVISPKPPSSGMHLHMSPEAVAMMISYRRGYGLSTYLKYVVFNEEDLQWIEQFDKSLGTVATERCLSVGTNQDVIDPTLEILKGNKWLVERCLQYNDETGLDYFANFRILPQLHTLLWGRKRGV
jgi:7-carboxy-7-deazaguanine synthase